MHWIASSEKAYDDVCWRFGVSTVGNACLVLVVTPFQNRGFVISSP